VLFARLRLASTLWKYQALPNEVRLVETCRVLMLWILRGLLRGNNKHESVGRPLLSALFLDMPNPADYSEPVQQAWDGAMGSVARGGRASGLVNDGDGDPPTREEPIGVDVQVAADVIL
jgi:hypothetical protein